MKFLWNDPDGGKDSNSRMYGLEIKSLFSVLVLSFRGESRDAFHTHAFNSVSWLLFGYLEEQLYGGRMWRFYAPSIRAIVTRRETFHQVHSNGTSWVLNFRGPWVDTWREFLPNLKRFVTLTHGRREVIGD